MNVERILRIPDTAKSLETDYSWVIRIILMAAMAFSMGRVEIMASFFPCGIALISAALRKNTLNLYLLLPVIAGILTKDIGTPGAGFFWGDFAAMLLCAAVFMAASRKSMSDFARMIICGILSVVCNVSFYASADMIYRLDILMLLFEVVIICGLYYVFHVFLSLMESRERYNGSPEGGVVALSAVWSLTFAGLFPGTSFGNIASDVPCIAALLCILVLGYKLGLYAGITAGASSAIVLMLTSSIYSSQVIIFICAGITSGLFSGLNRYTTALCFTAVCLIFGLVCSGTMGGLSRMAPLAASLIFSFAPHAWSRRITKILRKLTRDESVVSDMRTSEILSVLEGYRSCFAQLGQLYNIGKDRRSVVSHQFRGMEQVVMKLEQDIRSCERGRVMPASRTLSKYRIETSASGYARSGSVSGDSHICRKLRDGRYIMILCDGMGKGEAAAIESTLAVKTISSLIEAGFDTELALHTLNTILLLKAKDEIFSTVDIGIFDSEKASLKLYKIGAASTFIKRGNRVDAVKMAALPMGIVDGLKIDFVNLRLQDGDQIIMVSDGVTDSGRYIERNPKGSGFASASKSPDDTAWLSQMIASVKSKDPATMADLIINRTIENYGLRERDDLTVISSVVKAN